MHTIYLQFYYLDGESCNVAISENPLKEGHPYIKDPGSLAKATPGNLGL